VTTLPCLTIVSFCNLLLTCCWSKFVEICRYDVFVDDDTGIVTLTKPISGNTSFLAKASDRGTPPQETTVPVYIYVLPANRHAPRFVGDRAAFMATVPEDRDVGYVVGRVLAADADSGVNGVVRYHITGGDTDWFSMDSVDGTLALASPLDYETRRRLDVELTVRDLGVGSQSLEDRRMFTVMVADVNDNEPQFTQPIYSLSVNEDAPAGTSLGQLTASDLDRGSNAEVRFKLISGNASDVVEVGELDAAVMTGQRPLIPGLYEAVVQVANPGTNLSSTATLVVKVQPVNWHLPTFRRREYVFTLPNVTVLAAGDVVGAVDAMDADPGDFGVVQYFLAGDSNLGVFAVHRRTGILSVAVATPTSSVAVTSLTVLAKNGGPLRRGNFDVCSVTLHSGGGGDGQVTLTFERQVYTATVRGDSKVGYPVLRVSAFVVNPRTTTTTVKTSPDAVVFAIVAGNVGATFSVDSQTGLIRVATKLYRDSVSKYNLTLSASVHSAHPLTGTSFCKLLVVDCEIASCVDTLLEYTPVVKGGGHLFSYIMLQSLGERITTIIIIIIIIKRNL